MKAKRADRKSIDQKSKMRNSKKSASKKSIEAESLLNALARGVGRAAGTIARATRRIAASGEAVIVPGKLGKNPVKRHGGLGMSSKRTKTKSASRKPRRVSTPGA